MLWRYSNNSVKPFFLFWNKNSQIQNYSKRSASVNRKRFKSRDIRRLFLEYFIQKHDHVAVPSSSVIPVGEDDLFFTNAGMNQFKRIFLNTLEPENPLSKYRRVVNSQKCIRVGGKHNDLADVGRDCYHHTFFEMLGNWSFGDYFKREACSQAWDLLTKVYGLPSSRLYVTYFGGEKVMNLEPDLECREIWLELGVPADHILPFGMKDNFWDMGNTGPCGPCTEIHFDHIEGRNAPALVNSGSPEMIELWNLVFMKYVRLPDGSIENLPRHHVDTGMGLERLTAVLNSSVSNYDTDLFRPLFSSIQEVSKVRNYQGFFGKADIGGIDTAYRIVADHARMFTVAIADGLLPDISGANHRLRTVIRRAVLAANNILKCPTKLVGNLANTVADILGETYPEINKNVLKVQDVVHEEEQVYLNVLEKGKITFKTLLKDQNGSVFSGEKMFHLHRNCGIPEDVINDMITMNSLVPDYKRFKELCNEERNRVMEMSSKATAETLMHENLILKLRSKTIPETNDNFKFDYNKMNDEYVFKPLHTQIIAIWKDGKFMQKLGTNDNGIIILPETNFYAEAGGQPSDIGILSTEEGVFQIEDVQKIENYVLHLGHVKQGSIELNSNVNLKINSQHRLKCMLNHTATHILNKSLRHILGVNSTGSFYSGPDYCKISFDSDKSIGFEQLNKIEEFANAIVMDNVKVERKVMPLHEASLNPKIHFVKDKIYPSNISVISIGEDEGHQSIEACCGTHVKHSKDIGRIVIIGCGASTNFVHYLKAVTGEVARNAIENNDRLKAQLNEIKLKFLEVAAEAKDKKVVNELVIIDKKSRLIRKDLKDCIVSHQLHQEIDLEVEQLQRNVSQILHQQTKQFVNKEIAEEIKTKLFEEKQPNFLVHEISVNGNSLLLLKLAHKVTNNIPTLLIHTDNEFTHCSCHVPKSFVTDGFDAKIWANSVLDILKASGTSKGKNSLNWYFGRGDPSNKTREALKTATDFIEQHLKLNEIQFTKMNR